MQSNTKLNQAQKEDRKILKGEFAGNLMQNGKTTVAYVDRGNTVEFSLAVVSPDEKKFRRKVGEYHALSRFEFGETVRMDKQEFSYYLNDNFGNYL